MEPIRHETRHTETVVLAHCGTSLLDAARAAFAPAGLNVIAVDTATELPARVKTRQPVFVLLDESALETVLRDGVTVIEELKTSSYTASIPLVVLLPSGTAETAQLDVFRRGADECFPRPASPELLAARLSGMTRRYAPASNPAELLTAGELTVDLKARKTAVGEREVVLTRKEFDLLNLLIRRRGTVVYTTHLYHAVWGYGESTPVDAHTVKVHVSSLRGKLGSELGRRIVNLPGLGYRFDD